MKFVMTQAVCPEGMEMLNGIADVYVADNQNPNNYLDEMAGADALIVRIAKCDGQAIERSPNLKVIGRTGVGYDTVDVKTAAAHGIPVVITPGANNRSVAEHAVAMMFALSKICWKHRIRCVPEIGKSEGQKRHLNWRVKRLVFWAWVQLVKRRLR